MPLSPSTTLPVCGLALLLASGAGFVLGSSATDAGAASAQPSDTLTPMPTEMMAMMKRWDEHRAVSDEHKHLHAHQGTWLVTGKFWMNPAAPPQEYQMMAESTPIMNGLFVQEQMGGILDMGAGPSPWSGMSISGYDNTQDRYVFVWFDSGSSSMTMGHGEQTKPDEWRYEYDMFDPMAGATVPYTHTIQMVSADKSVMTQSRKGPDGSWVKTMELVYTRSR